MIYRNAVFNAGGGIDCEVEHPVHGWIPFTASADDPEETGRVLFAEAEPNAAPAPAPVLADVKAAKRAEIEEARKAAEHEGVYVDAIRYAGGPSNRQALSEALDLADNTGQTHFSSWKDSDGQFHAAHPVADVHSALLAIGKRRGELIDRESMLNDDITAAVDVPAVEAIQW